MPLTGLLEPSDAACTAFTAAAGRGRLGCMEAMPLLLPPATVLLGSVSGQSCGACVFIGDLLFTDPTLLWWIGVGHLQNSMALWSVACRRALWAVCPSAIGQWMWLDHVVRCGPGWTAWDIVWGTQRCCDRVGSRLVSHPWDPTTMSLQSVAAFWRQWV